MSTRKSLKNSVWLLSVVIFTGLIVCLTMKAQAQNWAALPPYNTLWPLWSPALSPVNSSTGLPTPLVSSLTPSTVLPVQPGLTWHPSLAYPWLLYNTPLGMAYYDPYTGIDLWPADILFNTITHLPINITLPAAYGSLPATPAWWLVQQVPAANWEYLTVYPTYGGVIPPTLSSLLTPTDLLL
jgi:hypothetical protein